MDRFWSTDYFRKRTMQAWSGAESPTGASWTLGLYQNAVTPGPDLKLDDVTEATFTGYEGQVPFSVNPPIRNADGDWQWSFTSIQWTCTAATPANTIYGAYLVDNDTSDLLGIWPFDNPVPITSVGDGVVVMPAITYGS